MWVVLTCTYMYIRFPAYFPLATGSGKAQDSGALVASVGAHHHQIFALGHIPAVLYVVPHHPALLFGLPFLGLDNRPQGHIRFSQTQYASINFHQRNGNYEAWSKNPALTKSDSPCLELIWFVSIRVFWEYKMRRVPHFGQIFPISCVLASEFISCIILRNTNAHLDYTKRRIRLQNGACNVAPSKGLNGQFRVVLPPDLLYCGPGIVSWRSPPEFPSRLRN